MSKNFIEKLKSRIRAQKDGIPFDKSESYYDSEDMRQVPFDFFSNRYTDRYKDAKEIEQEAFVKKYFDMSCGYLHLSWDIDAFWTEVAEKVMIPYVQAIYRELVRLGHDESNPCMYGDADGDMFWVPAPNPDTMVLVQKDQQGRKYLYVCTENGTVYDYPSSRWNFHIRQFWERYQDDPENWRLDELYSCYSKVSMRDLECLNSSKEDLESFSKEELIEFIQKDDRKRMSPDEFIKSILTRVDSYAELSDDHYQYTHRHSLDFYKQRGFNFQNYREPFNNIYGDGRDGGYIISIKSHRAEDLVKNFHALEMIATCHLPCLASQLDLDVDITWIGKNQ
jgi:hypothetical protein